MNSWPMFILRRRGGKKQTILKVWIKNAMTNITTEYFETLKAMFTWDLWSGPVVGLLVFKARPTTSHLKKGDFKIISFSFHFIGLKFFNFKLCHRKYLCIPYFVLFGKMAILSICFILHYNGHLYYKMYRVIEVGHSSNNHI